MSDAVRCRETERTFNTGAYTVTAYDTQNRPTSITLKNSSNTTISSESYTYDDGGNLYQKTVNSVTTTYGYDDIDQLTSESRSGYSASYTYDANGNRATKTLGGTTQTYNYDDADKLTSITQGGNTVKSFGYDSAGRTTGITVSGNTTTIAYDYEGRITTITYPNQSTNTFTYNGLDTRVGKVDSTGTKTFLRDGAYVTDPVINDGASYTPGISERRSSTTKFYHTDRLGSTERLTNTSQTTTDTREYDAFGLQTSSSGSTPTPFGFAGDWGYQEDPDSGLKLLGHRYYDPSTGRFLTRDSAKDGRNWYVYCGSDPINCVDPEGNQLFRFLPRIAPWYGLFGRPFIWRGVPFFREGAKTFERFSKHWSGRGQALRRIKDLEDRISRSKSPKERQKLEAERAKEIKDTKGHEKEMDQKWPGWRNSNWTGACPPWYS